MRRLSAIVFGGSASPSPCPLAAGVRRRLVGHVGNDSGMIANLHM